MTSSTNPEVYDIIFATQPEEDRTMAIVNMHKKLVKYGRIVPEILSQTDRQMDGRTN